MSAAKTIDGIELFYELTGQGDAVVLFHGHPFDHTMWQPQIDAFSDKYRIIAPDLRGYGKSSLPVAEKTTFEDYTTDVLLLLDELNIETFHLAGLSMGGQLIMEAYRRAGHRVRSLILADTFASLDTPEARQARLDAADKIEKEGLSEYAGQSIRKMIKAEHVDTMPHVAAHVMKMMLNTNPIAAATALRARAARIDYLNEVLPGIKIPTLIIVGRQDEFTTVAKAEEMQAKISDSQLVIIEDAGHMPNLEHPEEFNKIVLDFLRKKA